jgi:hypothetical protein
MWLSVAVVVVGGNKVAVPLLIHTTLVPARDDTLPENGNSTIVPGHGTPLSMCTTPAPAQSRRRTRRSLK